MARLRPAVSLVLCLLLAACARQEQAADVAAEARDTGAASADMAEAAPAAPPQQATTPPAPPVSASAMASAALTQTDPQRRFVRTAEARFEVKDVYQAALAIEDQVAAAGGFVVHNEIRSHSLGQRLKSIGQGRLLELNEYSMQGQLTVRVPSERTQEFLRAIARQMEFLDHRTFEARDVQFDILREQLARQGGEDAQQALAQAGNDGGRLRDRVEAVQAQQAARSSRDEAWLQQRELDDRIAFSTISLTFEQPSQVRTIERVDTRAAMRDAGPGFFKRLGLSMQSGWHGCLEAVIALAYLWPLWVVVLAGVFGFRAWRARRIIPKKA